MTPWPTKLWRATVVVALVLGGALADAGAAERDQFNTHPPSSLTHSTLK
jgi:hypothetical protein